MIIKNHPYQNLNIAFSNIYIYICKLLLISCINLLLTLHDAKWINKFIAYIFKLIPILLFFF